MGPRRNALARLGGRSVGSYWASHDTMVMSVVSLKL